MKEKTLTIFCHLGGLFGGWILPILGGVFTPLIIWGLYKTPERQLLNNHGKEAINFQISILLYALVVLGILFCSALSFGLSPLAFDDPTAALFGSGFVSVLGLLTLGAMMIFEIICVIIAIIKAGNEEDYHYPLTIRFLK